jgi:hypothetical protein
MRYTLIYYKFLYVFYLLLKFKKYKKIQPETYILQNIDWDIHREFYSCAENEGGQILLTIGTYGSNYTASCPEIL